MAAYRRTISVTTIGVTPSGTRAQCTRDVPHSPRAIYMGRPLCARTAAPNLGHKIKCVYVCRVPPELIGCAVAQPCIAAHIAFSNQSALQCDAPSNPSHIDTDIHPTLLDALEMHCVPIIILIQTQLSSMELI